MCRMALVDVTLRLTRLCFMLESSFLLADGPPIVDGFVGKLFRSSLDCFDRDFVQEAEYS